MVRDGPGLRFLQKGAQSGISTLRSIRLGKPPLAASEIVDDLGAATFDCPLDSQILVHRRWSKTVLRLLDRIKRKKGVWWMPWR